MQMKFKKVLILSGMIVALMSSCRGWSFGLQSVTSKVSQATSGGGVQGNTYVLTFKNDDSMSYPFEIKCMVGGQFKGSIAAGETKTYTGERCTYRVDFKPAGKSSIYSGGTNSLSKNQATFVIKGAEVNRY